MKNLLLALVCLCAPLSATANEVTNLTENPEITAYVEAGLEILGLDSVRVVVVDMKHLPSTNNNTVEFSGMVTRDPIVGYTIIINTDVTAYKLRKNIAHELLHIHQYESSELSKKGNSQMVFRGNNYSLSGTKYQERPWELEAFHGARKLSKSIKNY